MIDLILDLNATSTYDFRAYANPSDPLRDQFDAWVPYYRLKWAIARALRPGSILEIGVRYGYSARAFLDASPGATFLGLDNLSFVSGGVGNGFPWAERILSGFETKLIHADTQSLQQLPYGPFDLVHVDGQQDGDGTYRDLERALLVGRHILVDGYFWTPENFQASNAFLSDHRDAIAMAAVIPGFAGELLIRPRATSLTIGSPVDRTSAALRDSYTRDYYLTDCGGYAAFNRNGGRRLEDPRLAATFDLARVSAGQHVVDLGTGRGEIALAAARAGAEVDAVDYSPASIALAASVVESLDDSVPGTIRLHEADAITFQPEAKVDRVLACDIIEHLDTAELDRLYASVVSMLKPKGQFVVHTAPCEWAYRYGYGLKRRKARRLGLFLSPNPRTPFEKLMHVNEQTPIRLKRQLKRHFRHAIVWLGSVASPAVGLRRRLRLSEVRTAVDIFAVASQEPIDIAELVASVTQRSLSPEERTNLELDLSESGLSDCAAVLRTDLSAFRIAVSVRNGGSFAISSRPPHPIHLSYHWADEQGRIVIFDGSRTPLPAPLRGGEAIDLTVDLVPPGPGKWKLWLSLVQEGVAWFDLKDEKHRLEVPVDIVLTNSRIATA